MLGWSQSRTPFIFVTPHYVWIPGLSARLKKVQGSLHLLLKVSIYGKEALKQAENEPQAHKVEKGTGQIEKERKEETSEQG